MRVYSVRMFLCRQDAYFEVTYTEEGFERFKRPEAPDLDTLAIQSEREKLSNTVRKRTYGAEPTSQNPVGFSSILE